MKVIFAEKYQKLRDWCEDISEKTKEKDNESEENNLVQPVPVTIAKPVAVEKSKPKKNTQQPKTGKAGRQTEDSSCTNLNVKRKRNRSKK